VTRKLSFQDVAKAGLKFGDEADENENELQESLTEKYKPLLDWLKKQSEGIVRDGLFNLFITTSGDGWIS
jgi:heat shock protein beta